MAVFEYIALDQNGRQLRGTVPADSRAAALDHVMEQGLSPVSISEQSTPGAEAQASEQKANVGRVPASAVASFTRELANLLASGLSLSRALHLLRREASHPAARQVWSSIHDDVVSGVALADAMARWPKVFSSVYVAMVRAGEAGGFLHVVLEQIADFRTREQDLKGRVHAALIYPCMLVVLAAGAMIFLISFFIPKLAPIFKEFGGDLPALTRGIIGFSRWVTDYGIVLAVVLALGIFALVRAARTEAGRRMVERAVLRLPLVGYIAARFALVRFCRMLGTLVGAGVPLVASLRVAREALGNQTLADAVSHAIEEVQRGSPLSQSLAPAEQLFPPSVVEMIAVAEETGRLDSELVRLAGTYEGELDRQMRILVSLAEPALLFVVAGLIGLVVVGMLLPVFTLQDLVH